MEIQYRFDKEMIDIVEWRELVLNTATWKMPQEMSDWEKMLENTSLIVTAWDRDRLIGSARLFTDFVRWGNIYDVVVHRDYQGKGIGKNLILQLIEHPSVATVRTFWLGTVDKAEFYEKLGFRHVKEIDGHSMVFVRKEL
ncbi:MAG TPA: GNAT family N-acetyltransferase [Anoxybacillus sp.]|nr:GNAT family N-acetyltransferase [Anoxybacillus sp.]